jgi:hypothetical protein
MNRADSLLAGQTEDPPDDTVTTYEETRQAYQTFNNMRDTMRKMEQSQNVCVGQHEPLSERVGHPFVSAESEEATNTVFMMLERQGSGSILKLYQVGLGINDDNEYTIRNVQVIEEERFDLTPCVMGAPHHSGESPLEENLQAKMQGETTVGGLLGFTKEELEEATVNKIFWHGPNEIIVYSDETFESVRTTLDNVRGNQNGVETTETGLPDPLTDGYKGYATTETIEGTSYAVPRTLREETNADEIVGAQSGPLKMEEYIPDVLKDANHVMIKLTPPNTLYPQKYVCFLSSGEDGGAGVLGSQEYKTLLESTVKDNKIKVCSP